MRSLVVGMLIALCAVSLAAADTWTPFQFKANDQFEYRIQIQKDGQMKELGLFSLSVNGTNDQHLKFTWRIEENGTKTSDTFESSINQLSGKILVNMMVGGSELAEIVTQNLFAPTLEMQYRNLTLREGEQVNRRGSSAELSVGASQHIATYDGVLVSYREKGELIFEHVINKDMPLPLRVKAFDKDGNEIVCELVK